MNHYDKYQLMALPAETRLCLYDDVKAIELERDELKKLVAFYETEQVTGTCSNCTKLAIERDACKAKMDWLYDLVEDSIGDGLPCGPDAKEQFLKDMVDIRLERDELKKIVAFYESAKVTRTINDPPAVEPEFLKRGEK